MRGRAGPASLRLVAACFAVCVALLPLASSVPVAAAASAHGPPPLGSLVIPEIGFGYTVTSQGPLDASRFPAGSPSASAAAGALQALGSTIETYQRSWQDATGVNQVQDLLVRFSTAAGARTFVGAARRALARSEIVSSRPLPSVPGGQRTTYFGSTNQPGVGQTVTIRLGDYANVLSFFSGASGNPAPITAASAELVAKAQFAAVVRAAGTKTAEASGGGLSGADVGWTVVAVVVLAAAVTTPLVLRRRSRSFGGRTPETLDP